MCEVIISRPIPRVCVCFPMFVDIPAIWRMSWIMATAEQWCVCVWGTCECGPCTPSFQGQGYLTEFRAGGGTCMAWERFAGGWGVATAAFTAGDLSSGRAKARSAGSSVLCFHLGCSSVLLYDLDVFLHDTCLSVFFPGHSERADHACFLSFGPEVTKLKWVTEVLVILTFTNSAPSLRY